MHTKDRMTRLQMETTLAVLGDDRRYANKETDAVSQTFSLDRRSRIDRHVWRLYPFLVPRT